MSKNKGTFNRTEFTAALAKFSAEYDKEVANKQARTEYQQSPSEKYKHLNGMTQTEWDGLFAGTD